MSGVAGRFVLYPSNDYRNSARTKFRPHLIKQNFFTIYEMMEVSVISVSHKIFSITALIIHSIFRKSRRYESILSHFASMLIKVEKAQRRRFGKFCFFFEKLKDFGRIKERSTDNFGPTIASKHPQKNKAMVVLIQPRKNCETLQVMLGRKHKTNGLGSPLSTWARNM